jgi:hypothetical protein
MLYDLKEGTPGEAAETDAASGTHYGPVTEMGMPTGPDANHDGARVAALVAHSRTRVLPTRRLELYLAQVAQLIAVTMGGEEHEEHI